MYKLLCSLILLKLWDVSVICSNPFIITCSPNHRRLIEDKYINELRDQANSISKINYILNKGQNKIRSKVHELEKKVSEIQFYEKPKINVSECFNINVVAHEAEAILKKFHRLLKDGLAVSMALVQKTINSIRDCGRIEITCARIDACCDTAVDNFDVIAFEESIHRLAQLGEQYLEPILKSFDHEIEDIHITVVSCILETLHTRV